VNTRLPSVSVLVVLLLGGCSSRPDYVATPFFSEAAFRNVRPGMTEDEVRNLLGYPASRFGPYEDPVKGTKTDWNYTVPASWEPPLGFHTFDVTFGSNRLVSGTLTCEGSWEESDGVRQFTEAIQQCQRKVGDLALIRPDGSTNVLRASGSHLYLILLDSDVSDGPRLNAGWAWLGEALPELLQQGTVAGVKHLYVGHRAEDYGELVKDLPPETARECYLEAEPEFSPTAWDSGSRLVLYKAGSLWSVPAILSGPKGDLAVDDQKWLIHRLGAEAVGPANGSQPFRSETNQTSSAAGSRR